MANEDQSGLWLMGSFETGKRASHQECFEYLRIPESLALS
jgi:hypothetical protein